MTKRDAGAALWAVASGTIMAVIFATTWVSDGLLIAIIATSLILAIGLGSSSRTVDALARRAINWYWSRVEGR
jgi:hypothetical protein